jgi:Phosphomannomutase
MYEKNLYTYVIIWPLGHLLILVLVNQSQLLPLFSSLQNEDVVREMMKKDDAFFKNKEAMSDLFLKRLKFGTAGIRGPMGVGFSQMNDVVIIQTGQGILSCAEKHIPNFKESGIIVGYDGRHNSKR